MAQVFNKTGIPSEFLISCLGLADFQSHYGSAPISIVWKVKEPLPGVWMQETVKV